MRHVKWKCSRLRTSIMMFISASCTVFSADSIGLEGSRLPPTMIKESFSALIVEKSHE
ncbi:MAG: hypothetical protein ACLPN1_00415 [Dissulfurispiraceae bacterium]